MSASNDNYVCFKCRTLVRHPKRSARVPNCLCCGAGCFWLGYKVAIPRHHDLKAWQDLEQECVRRMEVAKKFRNLRRVRRQHFLEQEALRLRQLPDNRDRNRQIRMLEDELSQILGSNNGS